MKHCNKCNTTKALSEFVSDKHKKRGVTASCKPCRAKESQYQRKEHPFASIIRSKKHFCKSRGLPFDLDTEYLKTIYSPTCPVLGVGMTLMNQENPRAPHNATVDRLIPEKGYTKGNVTFMSLRANRMKGVMTHGDCKALMSWFDSLV